MLLLATPATAQTLLEGGSQGTSVSDPGNDGVSVPIGPVSAPWVCQLEPYCHSGFDTPPVVIPLSLIPAQDTPGSDRDVLVPAQCHNAIVLVACNPDLGTPQINPIHVPGFSDLQLVPGLTWLPVCTWDSFYTGLDILPFCQATPLMPAREQPIVPARQPAFETISFELRYSDVDAAPGATVTTQHIPPQQVSALGFDFTLLPNGLDIPMVSDPAAGVDADVTLVIIADGQEHVVLVPVHA